MAKRKEPEHIEIRDLISVLSDEKIKECIGVMETELTARSKRDLPQLVMHKYDCECPCCCCLCNKEVPTVKSLSIGSVIVEACPSFYVIDRITSDNERERIASGKRGSLYKFITIAQKALKNS